MTVTLLRVLLVVSLLACGVCATACAPALVTVGSTYYVQWPGQMPDVVEIHSRVRRDGWVMCRSVNDTVIWACNLNTATYFARVTPTPSAPQGQRTD